MFSTRNQRRRRSALRFAPVVANSCAEVLEDRVLLAASTVPSIDGTGNNLQNPTWGSTGSNLLRIAPAEYGDGKATPAGATLPSPRVISNALAAQDVDVISDRGLSAMIYAWGQFLDHDLDFVATGGTEPLSIAIPLGDPQFDQGGTGTQTMNTTRSTYDPLTGTSTANPRQQINRLTAWIDGSMIYGSDATTAAALRTGTGGLLKTSAGNLPPVAPNGFYQAGDIRANENPELTSLHALFVREHNYWAAKFASQNRTWGDEQIYQAARGIVIGEVQVITYNHWLPALLGQGALDPYRGYKPTVNPGIANEFAAAGFRLGHSLLGDDIEFLDNNGVPIADEVSLRDAFFNPGLIAQNGIDSILKYLASDPSSELDNKIVDGVRNFLSPAPGLSGFDLASLNIIRGRDHGLADYNAVRRAYGLRPVTSFAQITSNAQIQAQLQSLYGSVDNIDLWVGALAEDHVSGASVGPTLRAIISDQFERLRDGDRFWYEKRFSGATLRQIQNTTLADIIKRNTTLTNLQSNVFFFQASVSGRVFLDSNGDGRAGRNEPSLAARTIQLVEADTGEVVATTTTNLGGNYTFNVASGLRTGRYLVRVATAPSQAQAFAITRGDQSLTVNLAIRNGGGTIVNSATPALALGTASARVGSTEATPLASTFSSTAASTSVNQTVQKSEVESEKWRSTVASQNSQTDHSSGGSDETQGDRVPSVSTNLERLDWLFSSRQWREALESIA